MNLYFVDLLVHSRTITGKAQLCAIAGVTEMKTLKLIRMVNGTMALLSNKEVFPSAEWLAMQTKTPVAGAKWFTAWPLSGGQMSVQDDPSVFDVVEEVADATTIHHCCEGTFHGFNPAAQAIRVYLQEV